MEIDKQNDTMEMEEPTLCNNDISIDKIESASSSDIELTENDQKSSGGGDGDISSCSDCDDQPLPAQSTSNLWDFYMTRLNSNETNSEATGCSLAMCLNEFMALEKLEGKNQFGCEHCNSGRKGKVNKGMYYHFFETVFCLYDINYMI